MSCRPNDKRQQYDEGTIPRKKSRWERGGVVFFGAVITIAMTLWTDIWTGGSRAEDMREVPAKSWTQLSGNDGRLWRGTPDGNACADTEGAELRTYCQYFYDEEGRLSGINTFQRHDRYRDVYSDQYSDVWVLSNVETLVYDSEGRVCRRDEVQGDTRTVYEYTPDGYTERSSWAYAEDGKISRYDLAGNRIYFRNADNFRYPHVTTWEYDDRNRPVRKTLEVEGKEPYGIPEHVTWTAEYDEENHTSVETEYDSDGQIVYIWHCSYDENWNKEESFWYAPEKIPAGFTPEECADYYTRGYWVSSFNGRVLEKMENEPWKEGRNDSEYTACDYDGRGNCIMELKVYSVGFVYLYRYVYDDADRLTEQFDYNFDEVRFWEQPQSDGSILTLEVSGDEVLSVTRTAPDGAILNRFVYGEHEVETQQTPEGILCWQMDPSLIQAEEGAWPGQPGQEKPVTPGGTDTEEPPAALFYTVEEGDCLWGIAEKLFGDGHRYPDIYRGNRDVIGDDPGLILPGMRLYIETE